MIVLSTRYACGGGGSGPRAEAHLIPDSFLEVADESFGFIVLHLPELHRPSAQVVVQLHGEDGRRSALILRALLTCRTETSAIILPRSEQVSPPSQRNTFSTVQIPRN